MRRSSFLVLLAVLFLVRPIAPAGAATYPQTPLEVRVATLKPLVAAPGRDLRLSGTLVNRGDSPVTSVQVRLLLSSLPLGGRYEIPEIADGTTVRSSEPTMAVSAPIASIGPGQSTGWEVSIGFDELPLTAQGVYLLGVEALGTTSDGFTQQLGLTRTFLPWFPDRAAYQPTGVVWVWPLSSRPDRTLDGTQMTDRTAEEMRDGRLQTLLATADDRVTWVLDPALLQTARDMEDGYRAASAGGAGSGAATAERWLGELEDRVQDAESVVSMPYGWPDAVAIQRAEMPKMLAAATSRASRLAAEAVERPMDGILGWPPGGNITPKTLRTLEAGDISWLLLSDTAMPAFPEVPYTPTGTARLGQTPVVLADSGLRGALDRPQATRSEAVLARQQFLAEVAMTTAELPQSRRTIVAAPDPSWSPSPRFLRQTLKALDTAGYARLVPLSSLRFDPPSEPRVKVPYGPADKAQELPPKYFGPLRDLQRDSRRFNEILVDPQFAAPAAGQAVQRSASAWWRSDTAAGSAFSEVNRTQLAAEMAKVRIASSGTFTLPGESARIPVTVANDLDQDVQVGLSMTTDQPARLVAEPIPAFVVPAGRKTSIEVPAQVVGSGDLRVEVHLTSPSGHNYGEPVTIRVRTTAYSKAAAYVVTGAFLVLSALLVANFVRRRRKPTAKGAE